MKSRWWWWWVCVGVCECVCVWGCVSVCVCEWVCVWVCVSVPSVCVCFVGVCHCVIKCNNNPLHLQRIGKRGTNNCIEDKSELNANWRWLQTKLGSCPGLFQCVILVFSQTDGRNQGIILGMIAAGTVKICILHGHKLKALPHGKYLCTPLHR
jgi:hypothetical protein